MRTAGMLTWVLLAQSASLATATEEPSLLAQLERISTDIEQSDSQYEKRLLQDQMAMLPLTETDLQGCATECAHPYARAWSVHVLGHLPSADNQAIVASRLGDTSPVVREQAFEAMAQIGDRTHLKILMQAANSEKEAHLQQLAQQSSQQIVSKPNITDFPAVVQRLSSDDVMEQQAAIEQVARHNNWRVSETLITLLNHRNPSLRRGAVKALGQLGDDRCLSVLHEGLRKKTGPELHSYISAVARLGNTQSLASLQLLTASKSTRTRQYTARAFAWIPSSKPAEDLEALSTDNDEQVRTETLLTIRKLNDPRLEKLLLTYLDDSSVFLRAEAARLLANTRLTEAPAALLKALEDKDALVRINAATSLGNLGETEAIPQLKKCHKKAKNPEEKAFYQKALSLLGVEIEE